MTTPTKAGGVAILNGDYKNKRTRDKTGININTAPAQAEIKERNEAAKQEVKKLYDEIRNGPKN